jgi:uncharacterized protein YegL
MGRSLLPAFVVIAACALLPTGFVRADDEIDVRIANVDDSGFPQVDIVFTADLGGVPLADLAANQVSAAVSGQPATVVSIEPVTDASIPLAMVVAFDLSGSMVGEPLVSAREAASSLIGGLAQNDEIAIVTFADQVVVAQQLTADKAAALATLTTFEAVGNTTLHDATARAAGLAGESALFRRVVVLISDGEDFGGLSVLSREQSLLAAEESRVPIYVIGLGTEIDRAFLEEVAARTGGRFYEAPQPADLPSISDSLETLLRSQYVVTIEAPDGISGGETPEVSLRIDRPEGNGTATSTYRSQRPAQEATVAPATSTPAPATQEPTPVPTETPSAVPAAATTGDDGGGSVLPLLLGVGALAVALGAGAILFTRKRRPSIPAPPPDDSEPTGTNIPLPGPIAYRNGAATPRPRYLEVTGPKSTYVVRLGHLPATIGTSDDCTVTLEPLPGVAGEHLRVWWRDGKHMLHHVGKGTVTIVNGQPVEWASLRPGDIMGIGPYAVAYHENDPANAEAAARQ